MQSLYYLPTDNIEPGAEVIVYITSGLLDKGTYVRGKLVATFGEPLRVGRVSKWHIIGKRSIECEVRSLDGKKVLAEFDAFLMSASTLHFVELDQALRKEVKGLNRRLQIERQVFHGLMKTLISGDALTELKSVLDNFLTRLSR